MGLGSIGALLALVFPRFATQERDGLLLYNGRFNERHDFMALEIVDEQLQLTFSAGMHCPCHTLPLHPGTLVGTVFFTASLTLSHSDTAWHCILGIPLLALHLSLHSSLHPWPANSWLCLTLYPRHPIPNTASLALHPGHPILALPPLLASGCVVMMLCP